MIYICPNRHSHSIIGVWLVCFWLFDEIPQKIVPWQAFLYITITYYTNPEEVLVSDGEGQTHLWACSGVFHAPIGTSPCGRQQLEFNLFMTWCAFSRQHPWHCEVSDRFCADWYNYGLGRSSRSQVAPSPQGGQASTVLCCSVYQSATSLWQKQLKRNT